MGDEFVGAEKKPPLKNKMATSVNEVQKLSAQAKSVVGLAGVASPKSRRRGGMVEADGSSLLRRVIFLSGLRNPRQLLGSS